MAKVNLSAALDEISGKAGSVVFVETQNGTVVRPRTAPKDPQTPLQMERRNQFAQASSALHTLTPEQYARWQDYAKPQSAQNVYLSLTRAYLAMHPEGTLPALPPTSPFDGDNLILTVTAEEGILTYTADQPNQPHILTEILLQPLLNAYRSPLKNGYRHIVYHPFTAAELSFSLTVPPGWYAPAIRFLHSETGQADSMQYFGKIEVLP